MYGTGRKFIYKYEMSILMYWNVPSILYNLQIWSNRLLWAEIFYFLMYKSNFIYSEETKDISIKSMYAGVWKKTRDRDIGLI